MENKSRYPLTLSVIILLIIFFHNSYAQNSLTGDGFGGRSWYVAHNYQVGAYSAYTICGANNQLYGWGGNNYGELGDATQVASIIPKGIPGMSNVKFYSTGYVSGAIKNDNTAWVWGGTTFSGLSSDPTFMLSDVKFLDGGMSHICFIKNDSTVWAVGQNSYGELGNGMLSSIEYTPVKMLGISNAVRVVAVGHDYSAASIILLSDGTVKVTGGPQAFSPMTLQSNNSSTPSLIPELHNIVDIKGGAVAAFALDGSGNVYSFGRELNGFQFGSLGLGSSDQSLYSYHPPTKLTFPLGAAPIVALSANNDGGTALALDENGYVYGWGDNRIGQLGDGTTINRTTPVLIASGVIDIFAGEIFSYILKADNTLWATGASSTYWTHNTGSIWMNLTDSERHEFTQINPTITPMNLCQIKPSGVVPIKLLYFKCQPDDDKIRLSWFSTEEINFMKYVLEYSNNGITFFPLSSVNGKGSNNYYELLDDKNSGAIFYRLKMFDKDGNYNYSETCFSRFKGKNKLIISPVPSKEIIKVYSKLENSIKSIHIYSVNGQLIKSINNFINGEIINISDFKNGLYILKSVHKNSEIEYTRFIKL